jgi:hypothetical protein
LADDDKGDVARERSPLRACAQRSEDRLLKAAAAAFAREGVNASVKRAA